MKKIGKILKWIPPAFFALLILVGGASAIFFRKRQPVQWAKK